MTISKNKQKVPIFRYLQDINSLSEEELNAHGYYRGSFCTHGHNIRDQEDHWCYMCVQKIMSNMCGFDVNYLHKDYKVKYANLWEVIPVGQFNECWEAPSIPKRFCFPSYRSFYCRQKAENVGTYKLLYQCAWGDVGSLFVSRTCDNKHCCNPLHMSSVFNYNSSPAKIYPFVTKFQYEKLMLASKRETVNSPLDELVKRQFKLAISKPNSMEYPTD